MIGNAANNRVADAIAIYTDRTPDENFVPDRAAFDENAAGNFGGIFVLNADVHHQLVQRRGAGVIPLGVVLASLDHKLLQLADVAMDLDIELADLRMQDDYDEADYRGLINARAAIVVNYTFLEQWRDAAARHCPITWNAHA